MYRKILVAVDGSQPSALALDHAIRLAREQQARLCIVHVVDEGLTLSPEVPSTNLAEVDQTLYARGKALLDAAKSQAREAGVESEGALVEEVAHRPGHCILQQAQEWSADLIICGTHGRRGLGRLILGSNAEHVVRRANVPVLLLRAAD